MPRELGVPGLAGRLCGVPLWVTVCRHAPLHSSGDGRMTDGIGPVNPRTGTDGVRGAAPLMRPGSLLALLIPAGFLADTPGTGSGRAYLPLPVPSFDSQAITMLWMSQAVNATTSAHPRAWSCRTAAMMPPPPPAATHQGPRLLGDESRLRSSMAMSLPIPLT